MHVFHFPINAHGLNNNLKFRVRIRIILFRSSPLILFRIVLHFTYYIVVLILATYHVDII